MVDRSSPDIARAALELAIQGALMDDDSYGVGCDDQDALEAAASFSATFIANAIADLTSDAAATPSTLLTRARQFVADSGSDEDDSEVNAARNQLLAEMDAALTGSVAQATTGPREVLDALADKVSAKIAQLEHYKANDCQLDHARTIAEGRISQANQILHWIAEAAINDALVVSSTNRGGAT